MKPKRSSRKSDMQDILNRYMEEHGGEPVDPNAVYEWVRINKLWEPEPRTLRQRFREELSRAAREEVYKDPQGRIVRKKAAVVIKEGEKQLVMWGDVETAPDKHMRLSFQQRRKGIGGDVRTLNTDIDSYNDNNKHGSHIQMSFNFDEDLAESEQSSEYPEAPPDDESESTDTDVDHEPPASPKG